MDDFERDVRRTLHDQGAGLPESYDASPELLARARRRRATKVGAFAVALVVVAAGTAAAVTQVVDRHSTHRLVTSTPSSTSAPTTTTPTRQVRKAVATVVCPVSDANSRLWTLPATTPRVPAAGDPALLAHLQSFSAIADPRYTVLGPTAWSCQAVMATDGDNSMVVYDPVAALGVVLDLNTAPIAIESDFLWHGGVGSVAACRASGNPAAFQFVTKNFPELLPCPSAGRTVTRVDGHVSTFVDANGALGAVWIVLPSSETAEDGQLSVLTCRPTAGLTATQCDTIVADFVARIETVHAVTVTPSPTTSTTQPAEVSSAIADPPFSPSSWVATTSGMVISKYDGSGAFAAYDAAGDTWRTLPNPPPFKAHPSILAERGNDVFVAGKSGDPSATKTPFAVLDTGTGKWKRLAQAPDSLYGAIATAGDAGRLFVYGGINNQVATKNQREIALEYDIAADRWTKLPRSPLRFRAGSAVQWTGSELLVWGGGDYENGGPAFAGGAAYNPATRKWRSLPPAPSPASGGAASVWTGTQMIVWGGSPCIMCGNSEAATGAAYDPATNSWAALPPAPLEATDVPTAVWTGREMVVLSRATGGDTHPVAAYDPATSQWRTQPGAPPSALARLHDDVSAYSSWVGNQAIFGIVSPGGVFAGFKCTIK